MTASLPTTASTPLLRTDFADQRAWEAACAAVETPGEDDFRAYVDYIDDPAYRDLTPEQVLALVPEDFGHALLIVADRVALSSPETPFLVFDLWRDRGRTIRAAVEALWSIENNLSIANMDFFEFAGAVDEDGIFRGF